MVQVNTAWKRRLRKVEWGTREEGEEIEGKGEEGEEDMSFSKEKLLQSFAFWLYHQLAYLTCSKSEL